jgi:hypothetical protein
LQQAVQEGRENPAGVFDHVVPALLVVGQLLLGKRTGVMGKVDKRMGLIGWPGVLHVKTQQRVA